MTFEILLALSPIIIILALILIFRKPLAISAPIIFIYTLFLVLFVWRISYSYLFASTIKGFLVAIDITLIIFGAIFFLEFLKKNKILDSLDHYLSSISPDKRIQAIILVWFFGSFIEGTAGFGTPAAIVAPLLVGLGFPAITAVAIALIGNTTAVTFGAVGTPIRIGFSGLSNINIQEIVFNTGLINLFVGSLVPLMIISSLVILSKSKEKFKSIFEVLPFAIFSGLCFTIPYFLFTYLGQEFPSLLGSLTGLLIIIITTKKGFLVPKHIFGFKEKEKKKKKIKIEKVMKVLFPYFLLVVFLILGKFLLGSYEFNLYESVRHKFNFFNPGFAFIFSILISSLIYKVKFQKLKSSAKHAFFLLGIPFIVILFLTAFVQIMIYSGNNVSGMKGMIEIISSLINNTLLPFISPIIGSFGSFIAGSATVSNILFGNFQQLAANTLGYSISIILALQLVGAGIGNMIALTNIVAAEATVKLHGKEKDIIKIVAIPFLIYLIITGIIGLILI